MSEKNETEKMRKIVIIAGPTAVGKTEYAIEMAKRFHGEIVSADSMQIYKYLDIGSAKPTAEEQRNAKHYLIDEVDPRQPFSVAEYQKLAKKYISEIFEKGKLPIISGGTGLYINSLLYDMDFSVTPKNSDFRKNMEGLAQKHGKEYLHHLLKEKDPEAADRIHPNNVKKVIRALEALEDGGTGIRPFEQSFRKTEDYDCVLIGLNRDREELYHRINTRVDLLLEMGLIQEVEHLLTMGLTSNDISMKGIGYKEIIQYLNGECDLKDAVDLVKQSSRRYAKRQLTWFRRYSEMKWFHLDDNKELHLKELEEYIASIL